jgi:hypothetical protein
MTIKEDHGHAPTVDFGNVDVTKQDTRARINQALGGALSGGMVTQYVGLERARKVLALYHIFIPGVNFLEGSRGEHTFEVHQFGGRLGAHENGQIITHDEIKWEIHFTWDGCDGGVFCHACIREHGFDHIKEDSLYTRKVFKKKSK